MRGIVLLRTGLRRPATTTLAQRHPATLLSDAGFSRRWITRLRSTKPAAVPSSSFILALQSADPFLTGPPTPSCVPIFRRRNPSAGLGQDGGRLRLLRAPLTAHIISHRLDTPRDGEWHGGHRLTTDGMDVTRRTRQRAGQREKQVP